MADFPRNDIFKKMNRLEAEVDQRPKNGRAK